MTPADGHVDAGAGPRTMARSGTITITRAIGDMQIMTLRLVVTDKILKSKNVLTHPLKMTKICVTFKSLKAVNLDTDWAYASTRLITHSVLDDTTVGSPSRGIGALSRNE